MLDKDLSCLKEHYKYNDLHCLDNFAITFAPACRTAEWLSLRNSTIWGTAPFTTSWNKAKMDLSLVKEHCKKNHLLCSARFPMTYAPADWTCESLSLSNSTIWWTAPLIAWWNEARNKPQSCKEHHIHNHLPCSANFPMAFAPAHRTCGWLWLSSLTIWGTAPLTTSWNEARNRP
jgi:hypothetical protein